MKLEFGVRAAGLIGVFSEAVGSRRRQIRSGRGTTDRSDGQKTGACLVEPAPPRHAAPPARVNCKLFVVVLVVSDVRGDETVGRRAPTCFKSNYDAPSRLHLICRR